MWDWRKIFVEDEMNMFWYLTKNIGFWWWWVWRLTIEIINLDQRIFFSIEHGFLTCGIFSEAIYSMCFTFGSDYLQFSLFNKNFVYTYLKFKFILFRFTFDGKILEVNLNFLIVILGDATQIFSGFCIWFLQNFVL